jgi:hypothetical protein
MKIIIYMAMVFTIFSARVAFAVETEDPSLIPAQTLEEILNRSGEEYDSRMATSAYANDTHADLPHQSRVVCAVKNRKGQRFEARGFQPIQVQADALRSCERSSRLCYELGCQKELFTASGS